ncbi:MAG: TorF family putative porin [Rhodocyclaceae bacterium]|nr:TorF family putative porin [Rhodocyclaceae bacterium]
MHARFTSLAVSACLAGLCSAGAALAGEGPFSANVSITSDYTYRGISQTNQRPALQGGFDYAHDSGFYAGFWGSNVSWLSDADPDVSNSLELDVYAGYAGEIGPLGYDVGLLQYYYPGKYPSGFTKPHTLEGYVGLSWEFLSFKYSHAFTNLFGFEKSRGSQYYELGFEYPLTDSLMLDAHYGYQRIRNADSYSDWKLGVTQGLGGFDIGLHYVDTDIRHDKLAKERIVLSVSRAF